ncbi:uncharacterized protein THITE_48538 [Thermothielavioides terrestris NRRL 8126]|uniref:DNA/RNA-binding protein Alba-like domain-containing protein n=1 Tax=Thermothielavioides terrestris (strain ATCC 38088 / NRRL 8126) TaxID=578455 RepID=G2QUI4_THETT|nr:uncharacterized protein THITE_48538 [Thermothielavioides terrestris NRRL 8126]AEO64539.1 hypothetical protein THITE_48538 [Thermothielavioides terrestris NRRL 8126]
MRPPDSNSHASSKRKFPTDNNELARKKRRAADPETALPSESQAADSTPTTSYYSQVYGPLLRKLNQKYEVKPMSVMPSTSIGKHVDRALEHLGRFSAWDTSVLPGVVLLCAKSSASGKLMTIAEIIRRRIGESDQKWFQYNLLSEMVVEEPAEPAEEDSVVEDTFMAADRGSEEGADDEYFETIQPTIHERAVQPAKVRYKAHVTVLLSRVPLGELKMEKNVSLQTNEHHIEYLRKKKMGLVS